jgi:hypothetical protein
VADSCNPSYLGGWGREDQGLRSAWANSQETPSQNGLEAWLKQ